MSQARYWLLTIPHDAWQPNLPDTCAYVKGQLEQGENTGYKHWQVLAVFKRAVRLRSVKRCFSSSAHAEPSRSEAADAYVWKDSTRVPDTQFELGTKPFQRNSAKDWDSIREAALRGDLSEVPSDVYVRHYSSLRRIGADNQKPVPMSRTVTVYWGKTGVGKSRRAWDEATWDAYPKDPLTKFWDGYTGQPNVVIDEFRGVVSISHVLRWFDRYPVSVEIKGSAVPLKATNIWITSNLHPSEWYPDLDISTKDALLRRLNIIEIK